MLSDKEKDIKKSIYGTARDISYQDDGLRAIVLSSIVTGFLQYTWGCDGAG